LVHVDDRLFLSVQYPAMGEEHPGSLTAVPEAAAGTLTEKIVRQRH
jgi:hypothetical protein